MPLYDTLMCIPLYKYAYEVVPCIPYVEPESGTSDTDELFLSVQSLRQSASPPAKSSLRICPTLYVYVQIMYIQGIPRQNER